MVSDEVGSKLVRFLYFVGAGVICTKGINLWRDYERKAAMRTTEPLKLRQRLSTELPPHRNLES